MLFSRHHSDYGLWLNLRRVQLFALSAFFMGSLIIVCIAAASGDTFLLSEAIAVCVTSAAAYVLGRKGHTDRALALPPYVVAGCVFTSCYLFRGINDVGASLIPVLILLAGLLLNRRFVFSYATVVILGAIGIMAGRWWGARGETFDPSEARDLVLFVLTCALSAMVTVRLAEHIGQSYGMIRESEERLDQLAKQGRTTVWEVDAQGLYTYISQVSEASWGYRPDEVVGRMHFYDLHPEEGREAFKTAVFAVSQRKEAFQDVVHAVETKDGRIMWGSTNGIPLLNGDGTLRGYRGSCTDITERKRAEEILAASEKKYRALVEATDTGYLILDREGKVIDANREYVRLTGHSKLEEILGRSVIEWTAAHEKQKNAEAVAGCVKDGFIRDLVIDYVDGENHVTPVDINARVTGNGESLRIISLCRDITDRKRAQEVLLQLQLAQAQKMESIGRLAGGVAHDFNNLLTVINGYAAFLSEQLGIRDPLRRYALEIGEAGRRAASLTNQLLAFSRKRAIMPKAVDVNAVVADAERMLQRLIGEDIDLVSSRAPRLGLVMADPDQIHQIIMNLAVNARDAMPNGGKLEITTAEIELDEAAADAHPDAARGRYVQLTVTDTGTGMTEEVQRKIFEPFFTTKEQGKGTGLGLAMVYGAVRQHDGWIEVKSKLGRGSTFGIHLPCIDAGVAVDEAKPAATNVLHGDETVLVVEDQEAVRRLTKTILEAHGYRVLEAASGAEAQAVASRHTGEIDLLLTDVVLPGMDGRTLSEQLKDLRPNLRVILMSGYADDVIDDLDAIASTLAYIQKPFKPHELAAKVREILDKR